MSVYEININKSSISRILRLLPESIFNIDDKVELINAEGTEIYLVGSIDDYFEKEIFINGFRHYFSTNPPDSYGILIGETLDETIQNIIPFLNYTNDPSFLYSIRLNREKVVGNSPEYVITIYYKNLVGTVSFPSSPGVLDFCRFTTTDFKTPDFDPLGTSATIDESTEFGPSLINASPQHAIARVINNEANNVAFTIEAAKALQLCPIDEDGAAYAEGEDLDRIGTQFGIGRPYGFSDKNYWKLIKIVQFTPGFTVSKLIDICELYTGTRPDIEERRNGYIVRWHKPASWLAYFMDGQPIDAIDKHFGRGSAFDGNAETTSLLESYFDYQSAWMEREPIGMNNTLEDVLRRNSPAGVFIRYENLDSTFSNGAYGETKIRRVSENEGVFK